MEIESIPKLIIDILSKENRLTINEIFEKSRLPTERKEYLRLCVNRLSESKRIAKDGKRVREYLYQLKQNAINERELLIQLHSIVNRRMDFIEEPTENEKKTIKNIENIRGDNKTSLLDKLKGVIEK